MSVAPPDEAARQRNAAHIPPARVLLLVNGHSRRGREGAGTAEAALREAGLAVTTCWPEDRAALSAMIERAEAVDAVVVAGGDGTLNAAAPGVLRSGLPLGILPLGTANDLARTLGLPTDPAAAAAVVARGFARRIDMGEVNGIPYFNVASIGLGVALTRALTQDSKKRWGALGYAIAGARVLGRLRRFRADIVQGDRLQVSYTVHLAVGNGRHYGGGMTVSESASVDDGRLDVYSLEVDSVWRLLRLLPALRSGRTRPFAEIRTLEGEAIAVRTRRPRSVNADGEIVTHTPALFRVRPGAIRVFVPGETAG